MATLGPGDVVGIPTYGNAPFPLTVRASEPVRAVRLDATVLQGLHRQYPDVGEALVRPARVLELRAFLRLHVPGLEEVAPERVGALVHALRPVEVVPGELLADDRLDERTLWIVRDGRLVTEAMSQGGAQVVAYLRTGDVFAGGTTVARPATQVRALAVSRVLALDEHWRFSPANGGPPPWELLATLALRTTAPGPRSGPARLRRRRRGHAARARRATGSTIRGPGAGVRRVPAHGGGERGRRRIRRPPAAAAPVAHGVRRRRDGLRPRRTRDRVPVVRAPGEPRPRPRGHVDGDRRHQPARTPARCGTTRAPGPTAQGLGVTPRHDAAPGDRALGREPLARGPPRRPALDPGRRSDDRPAPVLAGGVPRAMVGVHAPGRADAAPRRHPGGHDRAALDRRGSCAPSAAASSQWRCWHCWWRRRSCSCRSRAS